MNFSLTNVLYRYSLLYSFDELCPICCLFTMSYVAMTFRQMSFVVSYEQDEFCRRSAQADLYFLNFITCVFF